MAEQGPESAWGISFGDVLKSIRLARGMTLEFIASRSGRNQSYLSAIERGKMPSGEFLSGIARYYGCPWWNRTRNELWLHSLSWIYGNDTITNIVSSHAATTKLHFTRAIQIVEIMVEAAKLSSEVTPLFHRLGEQLQVPGVVHMPLDKAVPIWAWISASMEDNVLDLCAREDVVDRIQCILTFVSNTFHESTVDIDAAALGLKVQKLRQAKGWAPENLAQVANRIWSQEHLSDPIVDTAYIVELEQGAAPINLNILGTIAQALDVATSVLLVDASPSLEHVVTESDILEMLRAYGLGDEAIASIQGLVAFWRSRHIN